ncbi:hypothetical protein ACHAXR_005294 [Thalassiosira sp. AJA248-18]
MADGVIRKKHGILKFGREWSWWEMMDEIVGTRIGLLLDLDNGTLAVYINGGRLGDMKGGLSGEWQWHASIAQTDVIIKRAPIPADAYEDIIVLATH